MTDTLCQHLHLVKLSDTPYRPFRSFKEGYRYYRCEECGESFKLKQTETEPVSAAERRQSNNGIDQAKV